MDATTPESFEFGGFRLDRRRRLLLDAQGVPVHVTSKAFDLLLYLLERPGHVVERAELIEALWPKTVVEDNNVNQVVAALRRRLGDGFIATVTGRGYQFVADVRAVDGADAPDLAAGRHAAGAGPAERGLRRRRLVGGAGIVLTAASIAAALVYVGPTEQRTTATQAEALAPADRRPAPAARALETLAVLPLVNLSDDAEQAYFADGLTEELINRLARIDRLRVTARTSSFAFRGSNRSVPEIAAVLGVRRVLEGSVARDGDRVRIRLQLVDAASGHGLWSEMFDRRLEDVFALQEDIALTVAGTLVGPLGAGERKAMLGGTANGEAYDLYLAAKNDGDGLYVLEELLRDLERIDRALALDPTFALAWARKSRLENRRYVRSGAGDAQPAAERAALRAIELAPDLGIAHTALAAALMSRYDLLGAEEAFRKAIELGSFEDVEVYGFFLMSVGHLERAREYLTIARARDPLNPETSAWLAAVHRDLGDVQTAFEEFERGRRLFEPWFEGMAEEMLTRFGSGTADSIGVLPELYPQFPEIWMRYGRLFEVLDDPHDARIELRALYADPTEFFPLFPLAVAATLGEAEFAVEELAAIAAEGRSAPVVFWNPVFAEMRRLPRFKDVVRAVGLLEYWREYGWPDLCRPLGDEDFECF